MLSTSLPDRGDTLAILCDRQVLYQLADVCELVGDRQKAAEWFIQLLSVVPSDAGVLMRLGQLCDADGDQAQAFHYFTDSHRYDPNNIVVIHWLGRYYIESQLAEKVPTATDPSSIVTLLSVCLATA